MGAPPRMGQHSSQQRRVPLVASSGPPQQQEQRSSSTTVSGAITANQSQSSGVGGVKSTRARARTQAQVRAAVVAAAAAAAAAAGATSVGIKRSVHSRLADMAAAPLTPTKRQRRRPPPSELVMLSLASSSSSSPTCYPRSAKALAGYRGAAVKQHRSVAGDLQRAGAAAGGPIPASATAISTSTTSAPKSSTSAPKNSTSSSLGVVMVASTTTTTTTTPLTNGSHAPSSASATSAISAASPAGAIEDRKPVESELRRTRHERAAHSGALSGSSKISSASTTTTTTTSSLSSSLLSATSSTTTATTTTSVLSPRLLASPANVVVKIERTAFDEARPDEQLRQAEMLAQKDEEIRRLRDEIARLQGQVATLEEQLADSERMRPPSAASTTMLTAATTTTTTTTPQRMQRDHRCLVNASSTSCGQINDRKARKTVRLLDPSGSRAAELNNGAEQSSSSSPSSLIPMAVLPYSLYQRALDADDDHDTDASRRPDGAIEVPRWREKPIEAEVTASSKGHGENLPEVATGDEVYLKRHLKLETYEKRRKRWDRQWLSEQKSFERARRRQARRQSGGSSTSTGTIGGNGCSQLYGPMGLSPRSPDAGPTVKTLFPSGNRLQAIEITDHVPVVAWGCNVPQFQHREFSLE